MFGWFRPRRGRATSALWLLLLAAISAGDTSAQDSGTPGPAGPTSDSEPAPTAPASEAERAPTSEPEEAAAGAPAPLPVAPPPPDGGVPLEPAVDSGVPLDPAADGGVPLDLAADGGAPLSTESAEAQSTTVTTQGGEPATPPTEPALPAEPAPAAPAKQLLEPGADPNTGIRGRIVDRKQGTGLELATVFATDSKGTRSTSTAEHGRYQLSLPSGVYKVRAYYDMYHVALLPNVRVTPGRFTDVNLLLDALEEEDVTVEQIEIPYRADTTTAAAQDELRKASSGIGEGMGAAQMSQSGASDAGSAAKRVVGVSVEGSNLVIRGLSGRYVRVLLNGDPLPSTDPDRPSVDLDLFPTSIIDSLTVSKSFLPPMPADFAGGVLEIKTINFPKQFTLDVGLSGEYSSQTTFRDYLTYRGGRYDLLGFDDGTRALPSSIGDVPVLASRTGRYRTAADVEAVAETFPNRWSYRRVNAIPSPGLDVSIGDSFNLPGAKRFGYMASASYDYKIRRVTGSSRKVGIKEDGDLYVTDDYPTVEVGSEDVALNAIGTAALDVGIDHSLNLLTMYNRSGSDDTGYRYGTSTSVDSGAKVESWQLQYISRSIWFNQLQGDHRNLFGTPMRFSWDGFYGLIERDEPDRRSIRYAQNPLEPYDFRWRNGDATRFYSNLTGADVGGNASLRIPFWENAFGTLGGAVRAADRTFSTRMFQFARNNGDHMDDIYAQSPEALFSKEGLGTITRLAPEQTRATDSFIANQNTFAGFFMLETPIVGALSFSGGARAEVYKQEMSPNSPFGSSSNMMMVDPDLSTNKADRTDVNVLPAAALKYDLGSGMLLRAAYGMTVGRPQARELAPFMYYDFLRDRNIVGNLDLRTTLIHSADLRWEWFFGAGQVLSASLFYKNFRRPIEQQVISTDGTSMFSNTPSAQTIGGEFELRTSLEQLHRSLKLFDFGANFTLLRSEVEIPDELSGAVRAGTRRMFGQAPYVINLTLRFAEPVTKFSASLVYNVVGPRIIDVGLRAGTDILPNVEEQPFHALDLITSWQVTEHLKLKLKWRNMMFQSRRIRQGTVTTLRSNPGTFVSLGLDYSY